MRKNLAPARAIQRPHRTKSRKKRFLLYCEGELTEPSYLLGLRDHLRSSLIEIEIGDEQGDPKALVEMAKYSRDQAARRAKRQQDDSLRYDEVWCLFDVDEHTRLLDAMKQARDCAIDLAVSNPCFELWLLIHYKDQWAYVTRSQALTKVRTVIPGYDKKVDFAMVQGRCHKAIARASSMERRAYENSHTHDNPTTGVWRLVARLCAEASVDAADI